MKIKRLSEVICSVALLATVPCSIVFAHTAGGPIGAAASATAVAAVICYDDSDHLVVQIEDLSPPQPGMFMSLQVAKGINMTNVTDPVSGDGQASPAVALKGGNGEYRISANKTAEGGRQISVTYHCENSGNAHTGTEIELLQAQ
jgi:hypothetical protein